MSRMSSGLSPWYMLRTPSRFTCICVSRRSTDTFLLRLDVTETEKADSAQYCVRKRSIGDVTRQVHVCAMLLAIAGTNGVSLG